MVPLYKEIVCPVCRDKHFVVKYEVGYIYSYFIDKDAPGLKNKDELLPFMFDNREQKESKQYIECVNCNAQFSCFLSAESHCIDYNDLEKAVSLVNLIPGSGSAGNSSRNRPESQSN